MESVELKFSHIILGSYWQPSLEMEEVDLPECPLDLLEELNFTVKLVAKAIKNKSKEGICLKCWN